MSLSSGIRVGKSDSRGSVRYLIDPLTQAILATYDAGTGLRLAQYNQNPQKLDEVFSYKTAQGAKYYPHTDMLGSVYVLSDSTGTPQATWSYDVYGTRTQTSGTMSYAFGFTGREHDGDTGLIYSRQRYYDPSVGGWLSPDRLYRPNLRGKVFAAGWNRYLYASASPTLRIDPTGMLDIGGPEVDLVVEGADAEEAIEVVSTNWVLGAAAFAFGIGFLAGTWLNSYVGDDIQALLWNMFGGDPGVSTQPSSCPSNQIWTPGTPGSPVANAYQHYLDHGDDFQSENALQYVQQATAFIQNPPPDAQFIVWSNGDQVIYSPSTNSFAVVDASGIPRTFFKPSNGQNYFNGQQ